MALYSSQHNCLSPSDGGAGALWFQLRVELAAGFLAPVFIPTLGGALASDFFLFSHVFPHQAANVGGGGGSSLLDCSLFLPWPPPHTLIYIEHSCQPRGIQGSERTQGCFLVAHFCGQFQFPVSQLILKCFPWEMQHHCIRKYS